MEQSYKVVYRKLYEEHWWWQARRSFLLDSLRGLHLLPGKQATILDVGCGDGLFFDDLLHFGDVEGVEPEADLVSPENPYRDRIYVCDFVKSFNPSKRYSLILMLDVLEHLSDPSLALNKVAALLAPNGVFLATVPAFEVLWTNHDLLNRHVTRFTRKTLRPLMQNAQLQITSERYWFQWLFPIKFAVATSEAIFRPVPKPPAVPRKWLNRLAYLVSMHENKYFKSHSFPFGSSLMITATRFTP